MRIKRFRFRINIPTIFLITIIFLLQFTTITRNWNSLILWQSDTTSIAFAKSNDHSIGMRQKLVRTSLEDKRGLEIEFLKLKTLGVTYNAYSGGNPW